MSSANYPVLINQVFHSKGKSQDFVKNILLVLIGSWGLAIASKVSIPFYPVPMSMQTFAVLLIGAMYGPKLGPATVLAYLLQGAAGLPFFASGAGLACFFGPTFGYLIGFVFASFLVGFGATLGHDRIILKSLVWFALGHATILLFGLSWMTFLFGFEKALAVGLYPFIICAIFKFVLASLSINALWHYFKSK